MLVVAMKVAAECSWVFLLKRFSGNMGLGKLRIASLGPLGRIRPLPLILPESWANNVARSGRVSPRTCS